MLLVIVTGLNVVECIVLGDFGGFLFVTSVVLISHVLFSSPRCGRAPASVAC